jgi:hypothetical protein
MQFGGEPGFSRELRDFYRIEFHVRTESARGGRKGFRHHELPRGNPTVSGAFVSKIGRKKKKADRSDSPRS